MVLKAATNVAVEANKLWQMRSVVLAILDKGLLEPEPTVLLVWAHQDLSWKKMQLITGVTKLIKLGLKPGPTGPIELIGLVHITKVQVIEFEQAHDVFEFSD